MKERGRKEWGRGQQRKRKREVVGEGGKGGRQVRGREKGKEKREKLIDVCRFSDDHGSGKALAATGHRGWDSN